MRPRSLLAAVAAGLTTLPATLPAQDIQFHGQVRPRYEYRDPAGTGRDEFTSMRVRVSLEATVDPGLTVFVQAQDVRIWGEERSTLTDYSADNFDLHQAYLRYRGQELDWLTATLGRMEAAFGGQRLIGPVGWAQQGRAFDGVRLDAGRGSRSLSLIAFTLADATAPTHSADAELYGAYATLGDFGPGGLDLYWLFDRGEGVAETRQSTFGARYAFESGAVSGRFEGSLQRGDRAGAPVSAYMFGGRLGSTLAEGKAGVTLWYDYLSGDDDLSDSETKVFSTLYATGHKFYGFADLFTNIPAHTGGRGLQDLALKLSASPWDDVTLGADLHSFSAAEGGALPTAHFANEIDLTLAHRYSANLTVTVGASFVFQDEGLGAVGRLGEDMQWVYVMFDAIF